MDVLMQNFEIHNFKCSPIKHISFQESERLLCVIRIDFSVELWSTDGSFLKLFQYPTNPGAHTSKFISNDRLLVSCFDGSLYYYSKIFPKSELLCHLQDGTPWDFCEYTNNTILVVSENGSLIQYDSESWTVKRHIIHGDNKERLICICTNNNGTWIAVGGSEGTVQFISSNWHIEATYVQPKAIIWTICSVENNSHQFVTGDSRGRLCLWQADSATRLFLLITHSADILCITSMLDSNIYCSGVDSKIVQVSIHKDSLHKSHSISFNSHDVRGLCIDKQRKLIIAASNDGNLRCTDILKIMPHDNRIGTSTGQPYFPFVRFSKSFFLMISPSTNCELFLYDFTPDKQYVFRTFNEEDIYSFDILENDDCMYVCFCDSMGNVTLCFTLLTCFSSKQPTTNKIKLIFTKVPIINESKQRYKLVKFGDSCLALSSIRCIEVYSIKNGQVIPEITHNVSQFVLALEVRGSQLLGWINMDGSATILSRKKQWKPISPSKSRNCIFPRATSLCFFSNKEKHIKTCLIAYSNMNIVEVDLIKKAWTQWTRDVQWPLSWINIKDLIVDIQYTDSQKFLVCLKSSFILVRKDITAKQIEQWLEEYYFSLLKSNPFNRLVHARLSKDKILNVAKISEAAVINAAPMSAKIKRFNN